MIRDAVFAAHVSAMVLRIGSELDASVEEGQRTLGEAEFDAYRRAIGRVMGALLQHVMMPLYEEHPALRPKELE